MKALYGFLNALIHALHGSIVAFAALGWMFPLTRPFHLAVMLVMLGSWFILGIWMGMGYCFLTDWHWKIKKALGEGRPEGTYIHLLAQNITGRKLDSKKVDQAVVALTLAIALLSLALNIKDRI